MPPSRRTVWQFARSRGAVVGVAALALLAMTWLYGQMQSVDPREHERVDVALRELRSLDRTINQDVLRARFQLIGSYDPVLQSYRRMEELEAEIERAPAYLGPDGPAYRQAVREYRDAVTRKQRTIELFKYRTADLKELLSYLPHAGTGVSQAAKENGDRALAEDVHEVLELALLYNLTSDESYAPIIRKNVAELAAAGERASTHGVRRRVRTFTRNIGRLLEVKPEVDALLTQIFAAPGARHEEVVAGVYYGAYARAGRLASAYRVALYGASLVMLVGIAYAVVRLQQTARALAASNERLEDRVAARTRELDGRNREMQAVLDNVDQALFTVDLAGHLSAERSAVFETWFPDTTPGARLWEVVAPVSPKAAAWIELGWSDLADAFMPPEVVLGQLPRQLRHGDRHYAIEYRPITAAGGELDRVLLVISDTTELVRNQAREAEQRETLAVFQHLLRDRAGLLEFLAEGDRIAETARSSGLTQRASLFRAIHTLKGNASLYGIQSIAAVCHELESKMIDDTQTLTTADLERVNGAWRGFMGRIRGLVQSQRSDVVEITAAELAELRRAIRSGRSSHELSAQLDDLQREPAEHRLQRLADQAKNIALRLGRGDLRVEVDGGGVRLAPERWGSFWASTVHVLRNAIDHGLEPPREREALGKPAAGGLWLRTRRAGGSVVLEIQDDGRGIDWEAIRRKAEGAGKRARTQQELCAVLFSGGVSTKAEVTEISGRGAGVSACYEACVAIGGSVEVMSERGRGTTIRFAFPENEQPAAMTSVA